MTDNLDLEKVLFGLPLKAE